MSLYDAFAELAELDELPIRWDALPYADDAFAAEAVLDLHWQPGPEATRRECALVVDALELKVGARVLDLCCGPGRHSLELASRGCAVTGVDCARPFVDYAREIAQRRALTAEFVPGDARQLAVAGPFDAVLVMENTLSVFSEDDAAAVLNHIASVLGPAGRLFCDLDNAETIAREGARLRHWHSVPRGLLLQEVHYDEATGIQKFRDIEVDLIHDRLREFYLCKRIYTVPELHRLFARAGLQIVKTFGDWDGSAHFRESPKTIVVGSRL